MNANFKSNSIVILFIISILTVNCVPTSVLVNTKDSVLLNNSKVKRFSSVPASSTTTQKSAPDLHSPVEGEFKNEKSLDGSRTGELFEAKANPQKRGINSQLMFGDVNSMPVGSVGNGVWGDEVDPSIMYSDLQDFDDYPRGIYRPKPYDSLQSILHGEPYGEPVPIPMQYPFRYYGDRKKRSDKNLYDMRLKRESKLTPADMLALVALVEAGERAKQEAENEEANSYAKPYFSPYGTQLDNDNVLMNTWLDPATDYYSLPYNLNDISKYELMKDQTYPANHYPDKRFMVAKRKRSLGHFLNEPVEVPSISYDAKFAPPDYLTKSPKKYQQFF